MTEHEEPKRKEPEAIPPEPFSFPKVYKHDGRLYVEHGAELPDHLCLCCGRKASRLVTRYVRNPKDPRTWFGKTYALQVGLCRKHADDANVGRALTFSVLSVGALLFIAGAVTLSIPTIVVGALAMGISGIFRAMVPVTSPNPMANPIVLERVSPSYLAEIAELSDEAVIHAEEDEFSD